MLFRKPPVLPIYPLSVTSITYIDLYLFEKSVDKKFRCNYRFNFPKPRINLWKNVIQLFTYVDSVTSRGYSSND